MGALVSVASFCIFVGFMIVNKNEGGSITKARLSNTFLGKELYRAGLIQEAFAEKKTCVRKPSCPSIESIPNPLTFPPRKPGRDGFDGNSRRSDEIVEIMVELHTTPEAAIRISGREWPAWAIQDRLKKLTYDSLMTVYYNLDRMKNDIRNIQELPDCYLDEHRQLRRKANLLAEYGAHPV